MVDFDAYIKHTVKLTLVIYKIYHYQIALWKKLISFRKKTKKNHWLDYAEDSFSNRMTINDTKKTLHLLSLYIPLSVFWSLFDQQVNIHNFVN